MLKRRLKGLIVLIVGILLVIVGPIISIIPLLPGWILTTIGVLLLTLYFPSLRLRLDSYVTHWPKASKLIHKVRTWADRHIGEL